LTKIFSGVGNVLAGGLFINPFGQHASGLRAIISSKDLEIAELSTDDATALEFNSRDFLPRVFKCCSNALELSYRLQRDPRVKKVYYPGLRDDGQPDPLYQSLLRSYSNGKAGYGCLVSILLQNESFTPLFFDNMKVSKGPSLGTNFTLACPYTLLAHYQELPWYVTDL
jgi:cystathionine gamma-synthase